MPFYRVFDFWGLVFECTKNTFIIFHVLYCCSNSLPRPSVTLFSPEQELTFFGVEFVLK